MDFYRVVIRHGCLLVMVGAAALLTKYPPSCSAREQSKLETDLARMRHVDRARSTDLSELETRCLKLIADHNSPVEKGKIYATIAAIYSDGGYRSSDEARIAKTVEYAKRALEYPVDVLTACDMYGRWVGAVTVQSRKYENAQFAQTRRDALATGLKGLKLALDHGAPGTPQPIPAVARLDVGPESPAYKRMMEERKQQVAAAEKAEFENELYRQRWTLTRLLVTLYSRAPYDVEQFKSEAQKALVGKPEVVGEIAAEIEKAITFDRSIHSRDPNAFPRR